MYPEYGRRRDCSSHRQSRTVHDRFRSHGSSVHGHVSWIPAALCLAILAKSSCTGYLGHPLKNMDFETENDLPPLLANTGRSVYNQTSSYNILMLERRYSHIWSSFCYGWCFDISPVAEGGLLGCALLSLCSLYETARDLLAARNPHRPREKQVSAHRGKALLRQQLIMLKRQVKRPACTKTDRVFLVLLARWVRTWQQALLIVQPDTRLALASGALSPVLETQVKDLFPQAEGRRRNDRLDQADGEGKSTLGC
jgi:hypothetical protein